MEDSKLLQLLKRLRVTGDRISEDELTSILHAATEAYQVPPLQNPTVPHTPADFTGVASDGELLLNVFLRVLESMQYYQQQGQCFTPLLLRTVAVTCVLNASQFIDGDCDWSSGKVAEVAERVLLKLCEVYRCGSVQELLSGKCARGSKMDNDGREGQGYLKSVLQGLVEMLNKGNWKMHPSRKMSYWWILRHIDEVGEHLGYLLPPALFVVDDWEVKNKVLGLKCLLHILQNTPGSELRWYGRAAVIYAALKPMLYSREAEVLQQLYPAIIQAARVLEADPACTGQLKSESHLDIIMQQLLQDMGMEQQLSVRAVYATSLSPLLAAMGLCAIRWSQEVMEVCKEYLATYDNTSASIRADILKALQVYVRQCWLQVHVDAAAILKMVVRLIYDTTEEECGISEESAECIWQEAEWLVRLLFMAAPNTCQQLCPGLSEVPVHPKCQRVLHRIFDNPTPQQDTT